MPKMRIEKNPWILHDSSDSLQNILITNINQKIRSTRRHRSVISNPFLICVLLILSLASSVLCNESTSPEVATPLPKTTSCTIGRLRECLDDEDCLENASPGPNVKVVMTSLSNRSTGSGAVLNSSTLISKPTGQLLGTCVCRKKGDCKRALAEASRRSPKFNPMIDNSPEESFHRQGHHYTAGWFFGAVCIVVAVGSISFLVYYYGFRYGMFAYYARQFGFIDNTQVEHQLLNRVSTEDGNELQI